MIVMNIGADLSRIRHEGIRQLLSRRIQQLNSPDLSDELDTCPVTFIVVEAGDVVADIEQVAGFPILTGLFDDAPFEHPDFYPPFEIMEEHHHEHSRFYELVFIGNDDGAATALFVPDEEGIDPDLLALCRSFATPAESSA